jgi:hypothetical protein
MSDWKNKAVGKLESFIEDIATLEVVTLSGELTVKDLKIGANDKGIKFQKVLDQLKGTATQASKISVVAATKIELDKDVQQFVKGNMTAEEAGLFNMHMNSIQYALTARKAAFDMLLSVIDGK